MDPDLSCFFQPCLKFSITLFFTTAESFITGICQVGQKGNLVCCQKEPVERKIVLKICFFLRSCIRICIPNLDLVQKVLRKRNDGERSKCKGRRVICFASVYSILKNRMNSPFLPNRPRQNS